MLLLKSPWRRHAPASSPILIHLRRYPHWHEADFWLIFYPHSDQPPPQLKGQSLLKLSYNIINSGAHHTLPMLFVDATYPTIPAGLLCCPLQQLLQHSLSLTWLHNLLPPASSILQQPPIRHLGVYLPSEVLQHSNTEIAQLLSDISTYISPSLSTIMLLTTPQNEAVMSTRHGNLSELHQQLGEAASKAMLATTGNPSMASLTLSTNRPVGVEAGTPHNSLRA